MGRHNQSQLTSFLEPKKSIKCASLYSGCGGMDKGFEQEGFSIAWANDIDHWSCETYRKNFKNPIIEGDVSAIDLSSIPEIEMILGGFPCQDFSIIWKRGGITTKRGNLYKYFVKAVDLKNPKIFLAENVKGLLSANKGKAIEQIKKDFSATGKYGYNLNIKLINFAEYGTPQLRERVLIIGSRKDIEKPFEFPPPTRTNKNYVTVKEALAGVEKVPFNNEHQKISKKTEERLKIIPPGGNFEDVPRNSEYYVKGMISHVYRRCHPDKPAKTIIACGGGGTWGYHYKEPRPLTNRERARLFGYPDDFIFVGSITEVRRQIGNSVPPVGIRPFARKINSFLMEA